jgi:uncharacterized membrane protein
MEIARFLHLLGVVVWVGGMFFAYVTLRPAAAALLEPPQRLPLWQATLSRFFTWVWVAVGLIILSSVWMLSLLGGLKGVGTYVHIMLGIGLAMMLIFAHVFFAPFKRLTRAVQAKDWPAGGAALAQIRKLVGFNLILGLATVAVAILGRIALHL